MRGQETNLPSVLLFSSRDHDDQESLKRLLGPYARNGEVALYRSLDELEERLLQPDAGRVVVLLLVSGPDELRDMAAVADNVSFLGRDLILLLPERSPDLLDLGYRLFPRYIGFRGEGFEDVTAILNKVVRVR